MAEAVYMSEVKAEQLSELGDEYTLAGSLFSAQNKRNTGLARGPLHRVSHEANYETKELLVAPSYIVVHMPQIASAFVALLGLDSEALPKIIMLIRCAFRSENYAGVMPPVRVSQPCLPEFDQLVAFVDETIAV
jgi:hypothetical protein